MIDKTTVEIGRALDNMIEDFGLNMTIKILEDKQNLFDDHGVGDILSDTIMRIRSYRDNDEPVPSLEATFRLLQQEK